MVGMIPIVVMMTGLLAAAGVWRGNDWVGISGGAVPFDGCFVIGPFSITCIHGVPIAHLHASTPAQPAHQ